MRGPPTHIRRILDTVRRDVRGHRLWLPGDRVLLACSGGRDSMAAMALLAALRPSLGHTLLVAHVDHGLQADHASVAALVQAEAARLGLPFQQRLLRLRPGADLEARARAGRYRALAAMARAVSATCIATAHHADDQAETLLLRLARGAGTDAWSGVRLVRGDGVVRPFLQLDRQQLAACASHFHAPWREDASNADVHFARNHLRQRVLPALDAAIPGASAGLARSAQLAAQHEGALTIWLDRALAGQLRIDPALGQATLPVAALPDHDAAKSAALIRICQLLGVPVPTRRAVDQWLALGARGEARLHGLIARGDGQTWVFLANNVARATPAD